MPIDPHVFSELYSLLDALQLVSSNSSARGAGRLTAPARPPVHVRCEPGADGAVVVTLVHLEKSGSRDRSAPNPLIQFVVFTHMAVAEVTRVVHHADYALDPVGEHGRIRPLVMKTMLAYARRWLQRLVADGYCLEQRERRGEPEVPRPRIAELGSRREGLPTRAVSIH